MDLNLTFVDNDVMASFLLNTTTVESNAFESTAGDATDAWPAYLTWIQKVFATLSILCSYVICREVCSDLAFANGEPRNSTRLSLSFSGQSRGSQKYQQQQQQQQQQENQQQRQNQQQQQPRSQSLRNKQRKRPILQTSISRILLHLSISDIIFSFAVFLGEWPAPRDTLYIHHASGNQAFCTFQGWMRALGYLASPMFSVVLNACYVLFIRYRWTNASLAKLERWSVSIIWLYSLALSILPIPLEAYNSDWDVCWITPYPLDCIGEECTRGAIADDLQTYYQIIHIWTCVAVSIFLMIVLFRTVRQMEAKAQRYTAAAAVIAAANGTRPRMPSRSSSMESIPRKSIEHPKTHRSMLRVTMTGDSFTTPGEDEHMMYESDGGESDDEETSGCTEFDEEARPNSMKDQNCEEHEVDNRSDTEDAVVTADGPRLGIIASLKQHASQLFPSVASKSYKKSRAVAYQGIFYTLAFLSTHCLDLVAIILWRRYGVWLRPLDVIAYMVLQPALGLFNFVVFSRNRTIMATPEGRWLRAILFFSALRKRSSPNTSLSINNDTSHRNDNV